MKQLLPLLLLSASLWGQSRTISGYVREAGSLEPLAGVSVYDNVQKKGTVSNQYGFFSLTLPVGRVAVRTSLVGYMPQILNFTLAKDTSMVIELGVVLLQEVVVKETQDRDRPVGNNKLTIQELKKIPALMGEVDVLRALTFIPGVMGGQEGNTGLYVRGGSPDQNLILLDDATIYSTSHLFGFLSVFNPDAIKSVELYKAGFPARYGGRLSSVIDIAMREGSKEKIKGEVGVGIINSRLTIEGPIQKGKSSFLVSGRFSNVALLTLPNTLAYRTKSSNEYSNYWFYDLNMKFNTQFKDQSQLFLSFYSGKDFFNSAERSRGTPDDITQNNLRWGNHTFTARYLRVLSPKVFSNVTLTRTGFRYDNGLSITSTLNNKVETNALSQVSTIRDWALKFKIDYNVAPNYTLKTGIEGISHQYQPANLTIIRNSVRDTTQTNQTIVAPEVAIFVENNWNVLPNLSVNAGLRATAFRQNTTTYHSLEPRLSLNWAAPRDWVFKLGYARMTQYLHLLSNNAAGLPNDIWVPATDQVPPQRAWQIAGSVGKEFRNGWEVAVETYWKSMNNLIDFKQGASIFNSYETDWQGIIEKQGIGKAYGAEFSLKKNKGDLTGWLSYTYSRSLRQFENINRAAWYPSKFDRPHNVAITASYVLSKRWSWAANWVYSTGNAITLPIGVQKTDARQPNFIYRGRNQERMPDYHRLDLSFNYQKATKKGNLKTWSFGVYNLYNRRNAYYIDFQNNAVVENPGQPNMSFKTLSISVVQQSIFPILPYISYSLKF